MQITKAKLKQIIKEEISNVLKETGEIPVDPHSVEDAIEAARNAAAIVYTAIAKSVPPDEQDKAIAAFQRMFAAEFDRFEDAHAGPEERELEEGSTLGSRVRLDRCRRAGGFKIDHRGLYIGKDGNSIDPKAKNT